MAKTCSRDFPVRCETSWRSSLTARSRWLGDVLTVAAPGTGGTRDVTLQFSADTSTKAFRGFEVLVH